MCTTLFLLSTLAMLCRRRFANRVEPEPTGADGAVTGSSSDVALQSSGSPSLCLTSSPRGHDGYSSWEKERSSNGEETEMSLLVRHSLHLELLKGLQLLLFILYWGLNSGPCAELKALA
ncbi:progressive rod-cone degeneration protein isoform X2 [Heterocephalus glaber]|uniref:Progressive rod-cone degeneration protein isoform X2 n=1 Tax=Heterocephalus glaber TaxID=10181 RepID=A0AAX6RGV4_HETGA|nr:progressive rod-cone degeneration protein isoform X2 [Heterocephalus glaber]